MSPESAPPPPPPPAPPAGQETSTLATISLVAGILGFPILFCSCFGLPFQVAAIITGHIALWQLRKNPRESGKNYAVTGLCCGYLAIILHIVSIILLIVLGNQVKDAFRSIQSEQNAQAMTNNAPASSPQ